MAKTLLRALLCLAVISAAATGEAPLLRVGHVGHDHHLALYVAADHGDSLAADHGVRLETIEDKHRYLLKNGEKALARVELVRVGGGAKMPTALSRSIIDIGLGGTAPVLAAVDKGAPLRLVAPLHHRGDMFVVAQELPVETWAGFVSYCKERQEPVRIGYKSPMAVAKIIFEDALRHEGLSFGGEMDSDVEVQLINTNGGGRLNVALAQGLVDGYAGNNPFPAIGAEKGILRVVSDLEALPPGRFEDHPCCCVAAGRKTIEEHSQALEALLVLLMAATEKINNDREAAVESATRWIGTSPAVERMSIPTSTYSMTPSEKWRGQMRVWCDAMAGLGLFQNRLKSLNEEQIAEKAYDLTALEKARLRLDR